MGFKIATDSTCDLTKEFLKENNISVMNLSYTIKGETYGHGKELESKEFYDLMREGNPTTTSQVNPDEAKEAFEEMIKENKEILYIAFSSGLSGTYNSVRLAAEEIMEEYGDVDIKVVDSLCASLGEGLLVYYAVKLRNENKGLDEVSKWVEDNKLNLVHLFTVDDLNHLFRGGRVSRSAALFGTMLNIKPVLHVDDEGHLVAIGKVRGRKKALCELVDKMDEKIGSFKGKNGIFFVSHGDCIEDAEFVCEEVKKRFGIKDCMINTIGSTIGSHAGPGTVALFFLGDVR